jgi:hypothetical protein
MAGEDGRRPAAGHGAVMALGRWSAAPCPCADRRTRVLRTDVKSYYAPTDNLMLPDQLAFHIKDRGVLNRLGL